MKILFANPTKSMQKKCKKKFNKNGTQKIAQGSSNLVQLPQYVKIIIREQTITWDLIVTCIPLPFKMLQKGNTDLLSSRDTRMVNVTRSQNYVIVSINIQILCDYIYISVNFQSYSISIQTLNAWISVLLIFSLNHITTKRRLHL